MAKAGTAVKNDKNHNSSPTLYVNLTALILSHTLETLKGIIEQHVTKST